MQRAQQENIARHINISMILVQYETRVEDSVVTRIALNVERSNEVLLKRLLSIPLQFDIKCNSNKGKM